MGVKKRTYQAVDINECASPICNGIPTTIRENIIRPRGSILFAINKTSRKRVRQIAPNPLIICCCMNIDTKSFSRADFVNVFDVRVIQC